MVRAPGDAEVMDAAAPDRAWHKSAPGTSARLTVRQLCFHPGSIVTPYSGAKYRKRAIRSCLDASGYRRSGTDLV
jgi:hypothetical protein